MLIENNSPKYCQNKQSEDVHDQGWAAPEFFGFLSLIHLMV